MNKSQFLNELRRRLSGLPQTDLEDRISFYSEMIEDRTEDGMTEEEAVAGIGSVDEIVEQVMAEIPLSKLVKEKVRKKRGMKAWEVILLVLGSPVWIPLLIAVIAVCLSLYITLWAVLISIWAVAIALAVSVIGVLCLAVYYLIVHNMAGAVFAAGAALVCAGAAILLFIGCKALTRGLLLLSKKMLLGIKTLFVGRESAER